MRKIISSIVIGLSVFLSSCSASDGIDTTAETTPRVIESDPVEQEYRGTLSLGESFEFNDSGTGEIMISVDSVSESYMCPGSMEMIQPSGGNKFITGRDWILFPELTSSAVNWLRITRLILLESAFSSHSLSPRFSFCTVTNNR